MAAKVDVRYIHFYTDGSAAKKIAPLFPEEKKARRARARKAAHRKTIYIDPVAIFSTVVACGLLLCMVFGLAALQGARERNAQMLSYVQELSAENEQLQKEYAASYDLQQIEQAAIALGMVPAEQVQHDSIQVQAPAAEQAPSGWDQLVAFLTNLFA